MAVMKKYAKLLIKAALSVLWIAVPLLWIWGVYEVWWALQAEYDLRGMEVNGFVMLIAALSGLGVWFIVCLLRSVKLSIRCCREKCWRSLVWCWLVTSMTWSVCCAGALTVFLLYLGGGPDPFSVGLVLPQDREYVLPRDMNCDAVVEDARAGRVRELQALRPRPKTQMPGSESASGAVMVPHLEKLSREMPLLLHEYVLRSLYAEAVNPRFASAVLPVSGGVYLWHAHSPGVLWKTQPDDNLLVADLGCGWKLYREPGEKGKADVPAAAARADAELAPLASNPVPQQLDAMLPMPAGPFLSLCADFSVDKEAKSLYGALLVVPMGYPEGTFTLKTYETTRRKPIQMSGVRDIDSDELVAMGTLCRAFAWEKRVYSGREGEFYGSDWEIWFTPAAGGEARCVAKQSFLLEGN